MACCWSIWHISEKPISRFAEEAGLQTVFVAFVIWSWMWRCCKPTIVVLAWWPVFILGGKELIPDVFHLAWTLRSLRTLFFKHPSKCMFFIFQWWGRIPFRIWILFWSTSDLPWTLWIFFLLDSIFQGVKGTYAHHKVVGEVSQNGCLFFTMNPADRWSCSRFGLRA